MTARLTVFLLGALEARLDDLPVAGFEYNKVRALLAYLAVESGHPHTRASLCALLWPDQADSAARQNLSQALTQLRKLLGDKGVETPFLLTTTESVQLNPAASWEADVTQFTAVIKIAEAHPHRGWKLCSSCARLLRQAIDLYRGDFLAQFYLSDSAPFEEWALQRRERLRQRMLSALERLAGYVEWREAYEQAAEIVQRQVELEPLSDESQRELMRLLALSGQKAAALALYETLRRTLRAELDVEPEPETTALYEKIRRGLPTEALRRFQPLPSRLPAAPTGLIGRAVDLEAVKRIFVDGARLLTITGTPGVGKTRLALEVAHQLRFDFEDGAYFVELSSVAAAAQAPSTIAQALGVKEQPGQALELTLQSYLQSRHALLALDNFEHIIEAAPFLARLLAACPGLHLLVTSRASLRLRAEQQYRLVPLSEVEAVQLFKARAVAVQPTFVISAKNQAAITALCRQLDNLPLGIELVAARINSFLPDDLLHQLKQRLDDKSEVVRDLPERQSSLHNAIAWSFLRLTTNEGRLFAHLGAFVGGFTTEAAQAVAGFGQPVQAILETLVENSLVQTHVVSGEMHFTLLETIRQYALEQLEERGEIEAARQRHAEYFASIAELTREYLSKDLQNEWYVRLIADLDNIRTGLRWASDHADHWTMLRIGSPLTHFWWQRGLASEGLHWLELALPFRAEAPIDLQAEALVNAGTLAYQQDLYSRAKTYLLDGLAAARQSENGRLIRGALANLGSLALTQGDFDQVETYLAEAIKITRAINNEGYARFTLTVLGDLQYRLGQFAQSQDSYAQALRINQEVHDQEGMADSLWGLARAARGLGQIQQASQYCTEAMEGYNQLDHEQGLGWVLNVQADIALDLGQLNNAVSLYQKALNIRLKYEDKQGCTRVLDQAANALVRSGRWTVGVQIMSAADAARFYLGGRMTDFERQAREVVLDLCRARLKSPAYDSAWEAGQDLPLEQAVALVD